jgi:hypothetical protein
VDGGFTQHDDAITTFAQQVQNMRVGHQWLMQNFGDIAKPRYGWHPDSFGATSVTPTLYALSGFDAVVHDRMDNDIKDDLTSSQSLEFMWQVRRLNHQ